MARQRTGTGSLSARLRGQLAHIRACEASGEALKQYAERKGLSIHSLYQAKKMLRKKGALAPARKLRAASRGGSSRRKARSRHFVEAVPAIHAGATPAREAAWRVRLPGGVVFESSTPLGLDEVLRLIERLGARS